jgi:hypothetical protein
MLIEKKGLQRFSDITNAEIAGGSLLKTPSRIRLTQSAERGSIACD